MAKSGSIGSGNLHDGLTNRSPAPPSDKPKGGSVDAGATRESTAHGSKTIGPRTA